MGQPPPEHPVVNQQEVHLTEEENISRNSRMTWFKGIGPNLHCTSGGRAHASGVRRQYDGPHYARIPLYSYSTPSSGAVLSEIASVRSSQFSSESQSCRLDSSGMDVSSAALSSAVVSFPQKVLLVDVTSNLHPFSTPVGCWTYPAYDNCSCIQLSGGCDERWCQVGSTCRPFP